MSQHSCANCSAPFMLSDDDQQFLDEISPVIAGQEIPIPLPTLCPFCRSVRRYCFRNERVLYPRACPTSGAKFISPISADKPFTVYENEYWYGDAWDAKEYGRTFDFSRPFFPQFRELMEAVPQLGRSCTNLQNCDYVNQVGWSKDCYLIFEADYDEFCYYGNNLYKSRSSVDLLQCMHCELCYECTECRSCYTLRHSFRCENCNDSWFLHSCIGCRNCIGCVNMHNKQYCIFNEQCSKQEYIRRSKEFALHMRAGIARLRERAEEFVKPFPVKYTGGTQNEESTGDGLWHTQRCKECYDVAESQDCAYLVNSRNMKKVYDTTVFGAEGGAEFCYETHEIGDGVRNVHFSDQVWSGCHDLLYCKLCVNNSHHLFGCVGMKHASYCIFNTRYTPEEYEKLVVKIIEHMRGTGEWGEFFPASISPFAYNETLAQQYFPLDRAAAIAAGYRWKNDIEQPVAATKTVPGEQLPEDIVSIPDDILQWAVTCPETKRPFKIVRQELEWYRQQNLPLPQFHPDERHRRRMARRNPRKLWSRTCGKCGTAIQTTYQPSRPEIVYCESCYLTSVY